MSRNLRFDTFLAHHGAKCLVTGPKNEQFLNTYPISTHARFEVNWTKILWDNARQPSFGRTNAGQRYVPIRLRRRGQLPRLIIVEFTKAYACIWHWMVSLGMLWFGKLTQFQHWEYDLIITSPKPIPPKQRCRKMVKRSYYGLDRPVFEQRQILHRASLGNNRLSRNIPWKLFQYHGWWLSHDDFIKWKIFPCNWPFVRGIHRSLVKVNSPHKGQWRAALIFSLICDWTYVWVNNRDAGDLRRHRAHYDVIVMTTQPWYSICQ